MVIQAYRFELDPSNAVSGALAAHAGAARFAFNWGLAEVESRLEARRVLTVLAIRQGSSVAEAESWSAGLVGPVPWSLPALRREWNRVKGEVAPWWRENSKEAYSSGLDALAQAFKNHFDSGAGGRRGRRVGWPKPKRRHEGRRSFRVTTGSFGVVDARHVRLPRIGVIRTKEATTSLLDRLQARTARVLSAAVSERAGRWWVCFTCEVQRAEPTPVQPQSVVVVEDLNVAGMTATAKGSGHWRGKAGLNRAILDAAFGQLRRQLAYKSVWYGSRLVVANRWDPSSKTCSGCKAVKAKLPRTQRTFRPAGAPRRTAKTAPALPGRTRPPPPPSNRRLPEGVQRMHTQMQRHHHFMGRGVARIATVVGLVAVLVGLPAPPPVSAESPIHPENRPSGLEGETNGRVRPEALVGVEGACRAGRAAGPSLALMLAAARADGVALRPGDCYRPANQQSAAKSNSCSRGNCACAAQPGTSMHGWGKAVDFRDAGGTLTFGSSGYRWLKANGARFGWNHPRWAEPGGSECPEAWHWEFVGDGGRMQLDTIRADGVGIVAGRAGGYWGVTGLGSVVARGGATDAGSHGSKPLAWLIKGAAATPSGAGYWLVASDGGVFTFGDAGFFGSTGAMRLVRPIVGMAATPSGRGYWLVASDGGVFTFGDAGFFGSTGAMRLNRPIVGMAATPSGRGYWLVASDGGVFTFGDAVFFGSQGGTAPTDPVVAMVGTPTGRGYWVASSAGAVRAFGDAVAAGALSSRPNLPVVGLAVTPSGRGYWLAAADGGVFSFGDAAYHGPA